jgi:hypothetical protein
VFLALLFLVIFFIPPATSNPELPGISNLLYMPPTCGDDVIGYCLPPEPDPEKFKPADYFPFVSGNIYFEYPSSWELYTEGKSSYITLIPSKDSPEGLSLSAIQLAVMDGIDFKRLFDEMETPCFAPAGLQWYSTVYLESFQGFHCLYKLSGKDNTPILQYALFNMKNQLFLSITTTPHPYQIADKITDSRMANKTFPNIVRIVESLRMWKR